MKGLYGRRGFETRLSERADAPATGRMARLRVRACGVCGTDLHFLRQMADWTPLGHEIAAEVIEVGDQVTRVRVGQRVIVEDVTMCGACEACKRGEIELCRNGMTLEGQPGMSDELLVHENMLNPFDGIDDVTAAMTEPLAVALRGVDKLRLAPLESVAIIGMGAIGLFSAAYARLLGAGRVAMIARDARSARNTAAAAAARDLGADELFYTSDEGWRDSALERGAFDAVVLAAPPALCADALKLTAFGGRALVMGVTFSGDTDAVIDVNDMVMNKKALLTSLAEPAINFPRSIELIRTGRIDVARVITHTLTLEQAAQPGALETCAREGVKTVVRI